MINMSQPIHKKYNVAITKQLGRYMEAIVVDTESTARQCIQYLKVRSSGTCNRNPWAATWRTLSWTQSPLLGSASSTSR
jgi:hypothetical protein